MSEQNILTSSDPGKLFRVEKLQQQYPFILFFSIALISFSLSSWSMGNSDIDKWKQEIVDVEKAFADLLKKEGLHKAFTNFAATDAVLMRNNKLIIGLEEIDKHLEGQNATDLVWAPDFVDVSSSGDMAYTYGQYVFTYTNEAGEIVENKGVFHTVWKRQADGKWKFVWD